VGRNQLQAKNVAKYTTGPPSPSQPDLARTTLHYTAPASSMLLLPGSKRITSLHK